MWSLNLAKKVKSNFSDSVEEIFKKHFSELEQVKKYLNDSSSIQGIDKLPNWKLKSFSLLIYGHLEGCIKNISDFTIEYIYETAPNSKDLTPSLFLKINHGKLSDMGQTNSIIRKLEIIKEINTQPKLLKPDCSKYIETRFNLNATNYEEICALFAIEPYTDSAQSTFLSDFVDQTRHPIAHTGFLRSQKDISFSEVVRHCSIVMELTTHFKNCIITSILANKHMHHSTLVLLNI